MSADLQEALQYFLSLTEDVPNGDQAMYVCGRIREACAMKLEATEAVGGELSLQFDEPAKLDQS